MSYQYFLCLDNITLYVLYMLMDMGCLYFLALVVSIGHQCSCISIGKEVEKLEPSYIAGGNVNGTTAA